MNTTLVDPAHNGVADRQRDGQPRNSAWKSFMPAFDAEDIVQGHAALVSHLWCRRAIGLVLRAVSDRAVEVKHADLGPCLCRACQEMMGGMVTDLGDGRM
jgi:hypothetical protein